MAELQWLTLRSSVKRCYIALDGKAAVTDCCPMYGRKQRSPISGLVRWSAALLGALWSSIAAAQDSYGDPQGSGPIVGALGWLQGTLLGTVATVAAIIAVAAVGFMMLTGRINWRYGATVILGCFILFGAASIVGGIRTSAGVGF